MDVTFRQQTAEDVPFLRLLYRSFRWEELAVSGWSEAQKTAFLDQQFDAQYAHYATHYSQSAFHILLAEGEPIGRLAIDRTTPLEIRIVDIGFLPEWRGRGLGTGLLTQILAEAATDTKIVTIHVEQFNPAQTLYRRLGFTEIEERGPYWLMAWHPPGTTAKGELAHANSA